MAFLGALRARFFNREKLAGFGTFYGVFLPNILSVIGVIFFMRLGVLLGHVGQTGMLIIIAFSFAITTFTALSLSATATNGKVGAGGTYYMVARCFGLEAGSAIGIALYISQILSAAFCICGFAESLHLLLPWASQQTIGIATLCALCGLSAFSTDLVLKTQLGIFFLLSLSIITFFNGNALQVDPVAFTPMGFWAAFAIFFPAATGIESGLAMSGSLRNPGKSLPLGSLLTVFTAFALYVAAVYFYMGHIPLSLLATDPLVMTRLSSLPALIYVGIWSASLSSVLSGLLAAPRTLAALANDGVVPRFIGMEHGEAKEPRFAILTTFAFILCAIYWGSVDVIGPVLSMFMLIAYAMLNFGAAFEELIGNPSWRPTFRVRWWLSALGGILCLIAMFMIDAGASFISIGLALLIYWAIKQRHLNSQHTQDIRYALFAYLARWVIYRLDALPFLPRSWRPNFLVFAESPTQLMQSQLLKIMTAVTRERGFLTIASIVSHELVSPTRASAMRGLIHEALIKNQSGALSVVNPSKDTFAGMRKYIESYGIGPISPNTIVLEEMTREQLASHGMPAISLARAVKKNVLIIGDNSHAEKPSSIDIWWDNGARETSALMLLIAFLLRRSNLWRRVPVFVKSVVGTELARKQREEYFADFLKKSRLPFTPKVYVTPNIELAKVITSFSEKTACVLMGMRPPQDDELVSEYTNDYLEQQSILSHFSIRMLCGSFEGIDFERVFD